MRIDIVIFDGVDELDALGPAEVFRSAGRRGADLSCWLVSQVEQSVVTGAHGMRVVPDGTYEPGADLLLIPGGGWIDRASVGAWGEAQRGTLPALIRAAAESTTLASVCTGAMLLASAGVIGERRATTHHGAHAELRATGATVLTDRVVDDGSLLTCGGVTSGIDLALWIVERWFGATVAEAIAANMEWTRTGPQR